MKNLLNQIGLTAICLILATSCNNTPAETTEQEAVITETPGTPEVKETPTPAAKDDKIFLIKTSVGDIKVKIYRECPLHQANFIKLVNEKFYDGIIFHRVIKGFMIQTGDPESRKAEPGAQYGSGGPGYTIPAEIFPNFHHKKGALAAARLGDGENIYKASSGSQFYIVQGRVTPKEDFRQMSRSFSEQAMTDYSTIGGAPELDGGYTVFGETISGIEVVDKIANTITLPGDRPKSDIRIISITEEDI